MNLDLVVYDTRFGTTRMFAGPHAGRISPRGAMAILNEDVVGTETVQRLWGLSVGVHLLLRVAGVHSECFA